VEKRSENLLRRESPFVCPSAQTTVFFSPRAGHVRENFTGGGAVGGLSVDIIEVCLKLGGRGRGKKLKMTTHGD
jgi:hypothetical protein